MNNKLSKYLTFLVGCTAVTVLNTALSASAQMTETTAAPTWETTDSTAPIEPSQSVLGATSGANELMPQPSDSAVYNESQTHAQLDTDIQPGRATRSGRSYFGVGGNIGFGGESALGRGNFAIISKVGLTNSFSVRPAAIIGEDTDFLIPITYDFNFQSADPFSRLPFAPYVGAGINVRTGDGDNVNFLLSGGVDVPLTNQFTATAGVNVSFRDDAQIGVLLGVGYNF